MVYWKVYIRLFFSFCLELFYFVSLSFTILIKQLSLLQSFYYSSSSSRVLNFMEGKAFMYHPFITGRIGTGSVFLNELDRKSMYRIMLRTHSTLVCSSCAWFLWSEDCKAPGVATPWRTGN